MRYFIMVLMAVMLAAPAAAGTIETIPTDGNGNPAPVYWDGSAWQLYDGSVTAIVSVDSAAFDSVSLTTLPSTWTDSVTIRGTGVGGAVPCSASVVGPITVGTISPYTSTAVAIDTALSTTFDTLTLTGGPYSTIYVGSDTDIYIYLTYAEAALGTTIGTGDLMYAGMTLPYNFSASSVWIKTRSGLASTSNIVTVRGLK